MSDPLRWIRRVLEPRRLLELLAECEPAASAPSTKLSPASGSPAPVLYGALSDAGNAHRAPSEAVLAREPRPQPAAVVPATLERVAASREDELHRREVAYCEHQGPSWSWSGAEERYYRFWRDAFLAGEYRRTDEQYIVHLVEEGPKRHATLESLLDEWITLRLAYPDVRCDKLDRRIGVMRLLLGRPAFGDEERRMHFRGTGHFDDSWIGFDLAVASGVPPLDDDVRSLFEATLPAGARPRDREQTFKTFTNLRHLSPEDPILRKATAGEPKRVRREIFADADRLLRRAGLQEPEYGIRGSAVAGITAKIPSFHATSRVRRVIRDLTADAVALVGGLPQEGTGRDASVSENAGLTVKIRRAPSLVDALPARDTIAGVLATGQISLPWESLLLLAVVLRMSDAKPYIEGLITMSADLRAAVDEACGTIGLDRGIGTCKRGFFYLLAGIRAPWWSEEPLPADPHLLKVASARARFHRNLQRELLGSIARERVLREVCELLAERARRDVAAVHAAVVSIDPYKPKG
jgi:hypothetical protein